MLTISLDKVIAPSFYPVHAAIRKGDAQEVVLAGGRGSLKSSTASLEVWLTLLRHPDCHAVVLRKVGNTLRNSVYAQMMWAADVLGITPYCKATVSPMEITYTPTGQKVMFFGLDDPGKVKSIKMQRGYVGIVWFEELDQFSGPEEIRSVEQSVLRGGPFSLSLKSFNPPSASRNWANRYVLETKPGKLSHHSTYLTTPPEWLGRRFLDDAAHLENTNPIKYRHEYLGEVVGSGSQIFENIQIREIKDDEIKRFDRPLNGVDWGYYPDPWAYNRGHYDAARRTLYLYDELTKRRASNQETAQMLMKKKLLWEIITADSAEPKSIGDYRAYGLMCRAAEKGPGSIDYSYKWLQSLSAIVIDPVRCPDTCREFSEAEYARDKQGEILEGYPDVDNHHIDAVRYMTEPIWKRRGQ